MNRTRMWLRARMGALLIVAAMTAQGDGFDKLPDAYVVSYGDPKAAVHITHYFSFTCPNCVALYREEFAELKAKYVDTGEIHLTFHPVPMDLLTVQGMHCISQLAPKEKKIFLEAILEEVIINEPDFSACLMVRAMALLEKPTPLLQERKYLEETDTFTDAFKFLKQEEKIVAVPTVEVNGTLYAKEIPDKEFIESLIQKMREVPK